MHLKRPELKCLRWAGLGSGHFAERKKLLAQSGALVREDYQLSQLGQILKAWERPVDKEVRKELLTRLGDENWQVRSAVVVALSGVVGEEEVRKELLTRLGDEDVRYAVVEALSGVVGEEEVGKELLARLLDIAEPFYLRSRVASVLREGARRTRT